MTESIAKHTKVDMIWVAGCSPTLVSHSLRGVAMNLKATTLTYLAIFIDETGFEQFVNPIYGWAKRGKASGKAV